MIKVLLFTNAPLIELFLEKAIKLDPGISLLDYDKDRAVKAVQEHSPGIVLIDVEVLNCEQIVSEIMHQAPCPILLLVSDGSEDRKQRALNCLGSGALDIYELPVLNEMISESEAIRLTEEIRFLSKINVFPKERKIQKAKSTVLKKIKFESRNVKVIGIGASTGGPKALVGILRNLPKNYPIPIVVVQHIVNKFIPGLIDWLSREVSLRIKIGDEGERIEKGTAYFAPDGLHTKISKDMRIIFDNSDSVNGCKPSIDVLMTSLADSFGQSALGILLTGMGKDGAAGMAKIHALGGRTIAQDEASCAVFGMPKVAIEKGVIDSVLSPKGIAETLIKVVKL